MEDSSRFLKEKMRYSEFNLDPGNLRKERIENLIKNLKDDLLQQKVSEKIMGSIKLTSKEFPDSKVRKKQDRSFSIIFTKKFD